MKKKLLFTLGATLMLALASCGNNTDNGSSLKKLDAEVLNEKIGKVNDTVDITTPVTINGSEDYFHDTRDGYYFLANGDANIVAKNLGNPDYSKDLGIKRSEIYNYSFNNGNAILEIVKEESITSYKHIFYSYKGDKITEKDTSFGSTFSFNQTQYAGTTDIKEFAMVNYIKGTFTGGTGDNKVTFDIYAKVVTKDNNYDVEFQLTKFEDNNPVKDSYKFGDYYFKEISDGYNTYINYYDQNGELDEELVLEKTNYLRQVYSVGYNTVYQASIPVSKFDEFDYYNEGVYYKLISYAVNYEKQKVKELNLKYVVTSQSPNSLDDEYNMITYRNIIDGKLEYESIGFVDDGFDIEYSLPNETKLIRVKGGYFSRNTGKLYNEDFEVIKTLRKVDEKDDTLSVSVDRSYVVLKYASDGYTVVVDTASGNIITEGDKISYSDNLIKKTNTDNTTSYYDVVNGQLSLIYSSGDENTNIKRVTGKSTCYIVVSKDASNSYYEYKIYAYGSKNALTLYSDSQYSDSLSHIYDNYDYNYYSVSNLYTDTNLTSEVAVIRFGKYAKSPVSYYS